MDFREYQRRAVRTIQKSGTKDDTLSYILLSFGEEAGELQGRIRPHFRGEIVDKAGLLDDLADLQWYQAVIAHLFGIDCEDIAEYGLRKIGQMAVAE